MQVFAFVASAVVSTYMLSGITFGATPKKSAPIDDDYEFVNFAQNSFIQLDENFVRDVVCGEEIVFGLEYKFLEQDE